MRNPFIILTSTQGHKVRVNILHIITYASIKYTNRGVPGYYTYMTNSSPALSDTKFKETVEESSSSVPLYWDNLNLKLAKEKLSDQLIIVSSTVNQESVETPSISKLKNLTPLKVLGMSSMAVATIGGASLLGIQAMQNSYQALNTSQKNIKTKNLSAKTFISIPKLKSLDKSKTKIKYINYVDPSLSVNNNYNKNRFYQFKASKTTDFFAF